MKFVIQVRWINRTLKRVKQKSSSGHTRWLHAFYCPERLSDASLFQSPAEPTAASEDVQRAEGSTHCWKLAIIQLLFLNCSSSGTFA